jgi:hypothetical protein
MSRAKKKTSRLTLILLLVSLVILAASLMWLQRSSYESGGVARDYLTQQSLARETTAP